MFFYLQQQQRVAEFLRKIKAIATAFRGSVLYSEDELARQNDSLLAQISDLQNQRQQVLETIQTSTALLEALQEQLPSIYADIQQKQGEQLLKETQESVVLTQEVELDSLF